MLAELTGPGALVRCWQEFPAGRLAFYFDGEESPRIECAAEHLFEHVPGVAHEKQPALMCLPYAKSLKIVVTDPLEVRYQLNYVTFPPDMPVESYSRRAAGHSARHAPGDLLSPPRRARRQASRGRNLRTRQHRAAHHRARHDGRIGLARRGGPRQLAAAATPAREALHNDDLWIEVTVDGESMPAIAAPARFLFPAFVAGESRGFNTMITTRSDGYANLLAMPYGNGITVAARNRGEKPIEDIVHIDVASIAPPTPIAPTTRGACGCGASIQPAGTRRPLVRSKAPAAGCRSPTSSPRTPKPASPRSRSTANRATAGRWTTSIRFWGRPGEGENYYTALSGRDGALAWRYMVHGAG